MYLLKNGKEPWKVYKLLLYIKKKWGLYKGVSGFSPSPVICGRCQLIGAAQSLLTGDKHTGVQSRGQRAGLGPGSNTTEIPAAFKHSQEKFV